MKTLCVVLLVSVLSVGCSSGSNSNETILPFVSAPDLELVPAIEDSDAAINSYGIISLRTDPDEFPDVVPGIVRREFDADAGAFAQFLQLNQSVTAAAIESLYRLPSDTCRSSQRDNDAFAVSIPSISLYEILTDLVRVPTAIDAGEVILFTTSDGTWLESTRRQNRDNIYYGNETDISDLVPPSELFVDLSGSGSFPAFSFRLSDVSRPELISPNADEITKFNTEFVWKTVDAENTFIRLMAYKAVGFSRVLVDCYVEDDGNFVIPVDELDFIDQNVFNDFAFIVSRVKIQAFVQDSSLALVMQHIGRGGLSGVIDE